MASKRRPPDHLLRNRRQDSRSRGASERSQKEKGASKSEKGNDRRRRSKEEQPDVTVPAMSNKRRWTVVAIMAVAGVLSYAPSLYLLSKEWERLPDYSHGWLVIPFSLLLAWLRRGSMPELSPQFDIWGMSLIVLSVVVRWVGAAFFIEFIDGCSILLWVAGVVWLVGGPRFLLWASPPIAFLLFMVPLPYTLNNMVRLPLQSVATKISTFFLQLLGQPALAEGNTIILDEHSLEVAQACSGLRIFVGILALAFFIIFMTHRSKLMNALIVFSVLPIALAANALRIVVTGMLLQYASGEVAQKFSHDVAGWLMIPVACVFFMAFLWYLSILFPRVELVGIDSMAPTKRKAATS